MDKVFVSCFMFTFIGQLTENSYRSSRGTVRKVKTNHRRISMSISIHYITQYIPGLCSKDIDIFPIVKFYEYNEPENTAQIKLRLTAPSATRRHYQTARTDDSAPPPDGIAYIPP